ncbi:hypothetical protein FY034_15765 [Trichlorobacter lovleyi]|uniref:hypothetical protein n=1 Tax=Trichlorobacter lovleyi TaxID=313985 RepID=UPI00223F96F4|nr:hypothetical protein [Trichlorobacter lovleyi]QOX80331.1 hypothetical protein FY034_15765 [Trichlorobacter lovleyi]
MKTAVLMHTFDQRAFIWPKFFEYFMHSFPTSNEFSYYFANEAVDFDIPNFFRHIPTGTGEWSERLTIALDRIQEDTVLYLQEDFLLTSVNQEALFNALAWHKNHGNLITKLGSHNFFHTEPTDEILLGHKILKHCTGSMFAMSHQPIAIFNSAFLRHTNPNPPVSARNHESIATAAINCIPELLDKIKIIPDSTIIEYLHCIADGELIIKLNELPTLPPFQQQTKDGQLY